PNVVTFDARLEKLVNFGDLGVTFSIDGFNLFNSQPALQRYPLAPKTQADLATAYPVIENLSPRVFRVGAAVHFRETGFSAPRFFRGASVNGRPFSFVPGVGLVPPRRRHSRKRAGTARLAEHVPPGPACRRPHCRSGRAVRVPPPAGHLPCTGRDTGRS